MSSIAAYATYADMIAETSFPDIAYVLGYSTLGEHPAEIFRWDSASTATPDGGKIRKPTSIGAGAGRFIWAGPHSEHVYPAWLYGAVGTSDDSATIQAAYTAGIAAFPNGIRILLNKQNHNINAGNINFDNSKNVELYNEVGGFGQFGYCGSTIKVFGSVSDPAISARGTIGFTITNISLWGASSVFTGWLVDASGNIVYDIHGNVISGRDSQKPIFRNGGIFGGNFYKCKGINLDQCNDGRFYNWRDEGLVQSYSGRYISSSYSNNNVWTDCSSYDNKNPPFLEPSDSWVLRGHSANQNNDGTGTLVKATFTGWRNLLLDSPVFYDTMNPGSYVQLCAGDGFRATNVLAGHDAPVRGTFLNATGPITNVEVSGQILGLDTVFKTAGAGNRAWSFRGSAPNTTNIVDNAANVDALSINITQSQGGGSSPTPSWNPTMQAAAGSPPILTVNASTFVDNGNGTYNMMCDVSVPSLSGPQITAYGSSGAYFGGLPYATTLTATDWTATVNTDTSGLISSVAGGSHNGVSGSKGWCFRNSGGGFVSCSQLSGKRFKITANNIPK